MTPQVAIDTQGPAAPRPLPDRAITEQLEAIADKIDFCARSASLAKAWSDSGVGLDAVEPVLRFMEANPHLDFGSPGPLAHFTERFCRRGYEERLVASIERRPVAQTVWMLHRLAKETGSSELRRLYVTVLRRALANPLAPPHTRQQIDHILQRLTA